MIDGTYKIKVDVLFASKEGMVDVRSEGDVAIVDVDVPIIGKDSAKGTIDGDSFTIKGSKMIFLVGKVNYSLTGRVSGDDLYVDIKSNKGSLKLKGVRV